METLHKSNWLPCGSPLAYNPESARYTCDPWVGEFESEASCQQDTFKALKMANKFVRQKNQITLDIPETITCEFNEFNRDCLDEKCPFHAKEKI